jgi:3-oxoacyl-[acyl-carrier-protein] synthase III
MYRAMIAGVGHYVPERVVNNFELEKMMDTTDEWIRERTGIVERRWIDDGKNNMDLAHQASLKAIENAGLEIQDIDFIIFATISTDYFFPGTGCFLQEKLGLPGIGALDIRNQCSGFVYGLSTADQFIKSGMYKNILLVGSEVQSRGLDLTTRGRDVAVIFGDGAGAAVISRSENDNKGILATRLHADGRHAKELWQELPGSARKPMMTHAIIDEPGIYPYMNGRYVFKHAVTRFPEVIQESFQAAGLDKNEVDLVIPHQANLRITEAVRMKLELPEEKVFSNIHKYGNTTAASIPIAMSEAIEEGRIKEGSLVCLASFGSGFTWASALVRF